NCSHRAGSFGSTSSSANAPPMICCASSSTTKAARRAGRRGAPRSPAGCAVTPIARNSSATETSYVLVVTEAPQAKVGLGTAPLGGLFEPVSQRTARDTVDAAWSLGVRFFDTAPLYGSGLAEERLGQALAGRPRHEFTIS